MKRKFDGVSTVSNVVACSANASNPPPPSEFGIPVYDSATFDSLNNSLNDEEFSTKFVSEVLVLHNFHYEMIITIGVFYAVFFSSFQKTYLETAVPENQTPSTRLKLFLKMTLDKRIVQYYALCGNSQSGKLALKGTKLFESLEGKNTSVYTRNLKKIKIVPSFF